MNNVIINQLVFDLRNFNNTGKDYTVIINWQDPTENDTYLIEIYTHSDFRKVLDLYVDSSGGVVEEYPKDELEEFVTNFLFRYKKQTIIKEF